VKTVTDMATEGQLPALQFAIETCKSG
jgi:hypothetical protein